MSVPTTLFAVSVWRETPFFSPRERAALAWTEAVTDIGRSGVSDALYDEARAHFTDKELVGLTVAVIAIERAAAKSGRLSLGRIRRPRVHGIGRGSR